VPLPPDTRPHTGTAQARAAHRENQLCERRRGDCAGDGFFKQQALDVTIQNFDSGVKVVQAVVAGDVAIGGASIEPVIHATVAGGKVAIIGTYANRLTVSMVTPKTITSVTALRGKHAGIQDVGAFREVMTRMVLESAKLTPQDVSYIPVSAPGYIQGLIAGQIHSAILQTNRPSKSWNAMRVPCPGRYVCSRA